MLDDDDAPLPHQLVNHPELAILAALDRTLLMAELALMAAHPVLDTDDEPAADDDPAWCAANLMTYALAVAQGIVDYRAAVAASCRRPS